MALKKAYSGAGFVILACGLVGMLSIGAGVVAFIGALNSVSGDEKARAIAPILFGCSFGGVVGGLFLIGLAEIIEAIVDTAKNTCKMVEILQQQATPSAQGTAPDQGRK